MRLHHLGAFTYPSALSQKCIVASIMKVKIAIESKNDHQIFCLVKLEMAEQLRNYELALPLSFKLPT